MYLRLAYLKLSSKIRYTNDYVVLRVTDQTYCSINKTYLSNCVKSIWR